MIDYTTYHTYDFVLRSSLTVLNLTFIFGVADFMIVAAFPNNILYLCLLFANLYTHLLFLYYPQSMIVIYCHATIFSYSLHFLYNH